MVKATAFCQTPDYSAGGVPFSFTTHFPFPTLRMCIAPEAADLAGVPTFLVDFELTALCYTSAVRVFPPEPEPLRRLPALFGISWATIGQSPGRLNRKRYSSDVSPYRQMPFQALAGPALEKANVITRLQTCLNGDGWHVLGFRRRLRLCILRRSRLRRPNHIGKLAAWHGIVSNIGAQS